VQNKHSTAQTRITTTRYRFRTNRLSLFGLAWFGLGLGWIWVGLG